MHWLAFENHEMNCALREVVSFIIRVCLLHNCVFY